MQFNLTVFLLLRPLDLGVLLEGSSCIVTIIMKRFAIHFTMYNIII